LTALSSSLQLLPVSGGTTTRTKGINLKSNNQPPVTVPAQACLQKGQHKQGNGNSIALNNAATVTA